MIQINDLKIHYGELVAVDRLSLKVSKGSIYGLIGPNGAGKSTTIKAIATLLQPTFGEILVGGIPVLHEPENARKILGYMPDSPPVYDDLKVDEFCDLFAHAYGLSPGERIEKINKCLQLTDLTEKRKDLCKNLSRGMKQRVLLAKTLVHDPSVLLLDEPTANLDPKARINFRNLLHRLASEGKTILVSSHILSEMEDLCDAIGIMRKGSMILSGPVNEIINHSNSKRIIQIELAHECPEILTLLKNLPKTSNLKSSDQSNRKFALTHHGNSEEVAQSLSSLVLKKVPICGFHFKQSKVEDLFLEVEADKELKEPAR